MELQSRFGTDERFRMDSRFLEKDEDQEEESGEAVGSGVRSVILIVLHWLPIKFRIQFKIVVIAYRALHDQAPAYIRDLLSSRSLRSSDQGFLVVPPSRLKSRGDCALAPKLWNSLSLIKICGHL